MKIAWLGQGKALCELARQLQQEGYETVGVVTYPKCQHSEDSTEHQIEMRHDVYESVFEFCNKEGIELLETENSNDPDVIDWLKARDIDLIISCRSRSILKKRFLETFPNKVLNIHIGDLPQYRGSGAMSWMILNGESTTAITYHMISLAVDCGDIVEQVHFDIPECAYPIDIYKSSIEVILASGKEVIKKTCLGESVTSKQNGISGSCYPRLRTLRDGAINFNWTPSQVECFIRAFGWPYAGAFGYRKGKRVHIARAKLIDTENTYHPYCNGLIVSINHDRGSAQLVCGERELEVLTVRDGLDEVLASKRLRAGMRLTTLP